MEPILGSQRTGCFIIGHDQQIEAAVKELMKK
jgi:hypothetical protein